eukprot:SAG31_NODE_4820_length_2931_cov_2.018008_5_plen_111_part_00
MPTQFSCDDTLEALDALLLFGIVQWAEQVTDMFGLNYNYAQYDPFHKQYPNTPFISSESCSCTSDRDYEINATDALLGPEHAWSCIKDCWQPIATRDWVQGSFDWTGPEP